MRYSLNNDSGYDCMDLAIETALKKENIPYFWVLAKSWGFKIDLHQQEVGNIVQSARADRLQMIKETYNISYSIYYTTNHDINTIKQWLNIQLSLKQPIIAEVDCYDLVWDRLYQKTHGKHMINLEQDDSGILYICDEWYQKRAAISEEELIGIAYCFIVLDVSQQHFEIPSESEAVRRCLEHYCAHRLEHTHELIHKILNLNLKVEFFGCTASDYTKAPIMRNIKEIFYNQKQTSVYFQNLFTIYKQPMLLDISKAFEQNAELIEKIRGNIAADFLREGRGIKIIEPKIVESYSEFIRMQDLLMEDIKKYYITEDRYVHPTVKCVVWDLDNTIWEGTIDSGMALKLKKGIRGILERLYILGIPCVVASKNELKDARQVIERFHLEKYFLHYNISWTSKWQGIQKAADEMNIAISSILFIDDSDMELFECKMHLPEIQIFPAEQYLNLIAYLDQNVPATKEARDRVKIYQAIIRRKEFEQTLSREEFLDLCRVRISVRYARESDLPRVYELVHRTNQFNLSGKIYSMAQLISIPMNRILVADMEDRFGNYGTVGAMIISEHPQEILLDFFSVSCKVEGRNIGKTMIEKVMSLAKGLNKQRIIALFRDNNKNQKVRGLFALMGFRYQTDLSSYVLEILDSKKTDIQKKELRYLHLVQNALKEMGLHNVSEDMGLADVIDSMGLLQLIMIIEQQTEIKINLEMFKSENFQSVSSFAQSLENILEGCQNEKESNYF